MLVRHPSLVPEQHPSLPLSKCTAIAVRTRSIRRSSQPDCFFIRAHAVSKRNYGGTRRHRQLHIHDGFRNSFFDSEIQLDVTPSRGELVRRLAPLTLVPRRCRCQTAPQLPCARFCTFPLNSTRRCRPSALNSTRRYRCQTAPNLPCARFSNAYHSPSPIRFCTYPIASAIAPWFKAQPWRCPMSPPAQCPRRVIVCERSFVQSATIAVPNVTASSVSMTGSAIPSSFLSF